VSTSAKSAIQKFAFFCTFLHIRFIQKSNCAIALFVALLKRATKNCDCRIALLKRATNKCNQTITLLKRSTKTVIAQAHF